MSGVHRKLLCEVLEAMIRIFGDSLIPEGDKDLKKEKKCHKKSSKLSP